MTYRRRDALLALPALAILAELVALAFVSTVFWTWIFALVSGAALLGYAVLERYRPRPGRAAD